MFVRFGFSSTSLALVLGLVCVLLFGCGEKPAVVAPEADKDQNEDPWPRVVSSLRKENDTVACRRILSQLNTDLASAAKEYQPESLQPSDEASDRELLKLTDDEIKELRSVSYTNLDSLYLAECLYLREAARSLDVAKSPPAEQARVAFDWVCRQVVLSPWILQTGMDQTIVALVPASAVLRRGSGSGLDRTYVFLALLQQLGLDGCLIGPPDAATKHASTAFPRTEKEVPKGPFWAAGVRVGSDVLLFDPWSGSALNESEGKIGTLDQVKAKPDLVKSWGVSADVAKSSKVFLSIPLTSAAPRMQRLEAAMKSDSTTRLVVNPKALRDRFLNEGKQADTVFWNASGDQFNYMQRIGLFHTVADGGLSPDSDYSLYMNYRLSMVPMGIFVVPEEIRAKGSRLEDDPGVPDAALEIRHSSLNKYAESFLIPPTPRERIQRGQFAEGTQLLVKRQKEYHEAAERIRTDKGREKLIKEWADKAREVFSNFNRIREEERSKPGSGLAVAKYEVDKFWKEYAATTMAIVDLAVADAGQAESTYLLALAMHEQAIRNQARSERAATDSTKREQALDSWAEAKSWWRAYEPFAEAQNQTYPGRADHARRLAEQAKSNSSR